MRQRDHPAHQLVCFAGIDLEGQNLHSQRSPDVLRYVRGLWLMHHLNSLVELCRRFLPHLSHTGWDVLRALGAASYVTARVESQKTNLWCLLFLRSEAAGQQRPCLSNAHPTSHAAQHCEVHTFFLLTARRVLLMGESHLKVLSQI